MVDIEVEQQRIRLRQDELQKRFMVIEGSSQEQSRAGQFEQADWVIKLDELSGEIQTIQGRLEESSFLITELLPRFDDQSFRLKEFTERLDLLDREMAVLKESVAELTQTISPDLKSGKGDSGAGKPSETVVLPGISGSENKTSGLSPSKAYRLAYNDFLKGDYDLALRGFENFMEEFKNTSLAPNAQYWIGESFYGKKDYLKAIEAFEKVISEYPDSNKVPGAMLKTGYAYIELSNKDRAKSHLKTVVENYPLSDEADLAKNRLAELN